MTDEKGNVTVHKDTWMDTRVPGGSAASASAVSGMSVPIGHGKWTGRTVFELHSPTAVPEGMEQESIQKLVAKQIVKMVKNDKWPEQSRNVVDGKGKCLGVTYEKSAPRVSSMSQTQIKIAALINETLWETMAGQDFEWTSLQVNVNTISSWHQDSNNVGASCILLLGDFDGGEFLHSGGYSSSDTGVWVPFDGGCLHASEDFDGYRISIVAFQHSSSHRLDDDTKEQLVGMGFRSRLLMSGRNGEGRVDPWVCSMVSTIAAPAVPSQPRSNRIMVELCTSASSRLGRRTVHSHGCEVVRVTIDDDLTTDIGLHKALDAVKAFVGPNILVWVSIPCTGGSPWQRINAAKSERARRLIEGHYRLFWALFANVKKVAEVVFKLGGYIAMEWPRSCAYWLEQDVQQFVSQLGLQSVYLDGCMFGLVSQYGANSCLLYTSPSPRD